MLEFDQAAGRLLVEAGATGLSGDAPVTLEVSGIDPGFRRVQEARFQPPASGQALDTETTAEGDVVLKAGQTPQTARTRRTSPSPPWALTARAASTSA